MLRTGEATRNRTGDKTESSATSYQLRSGEKNTFRSIVLEFVQIHR